MTCPAGGHEWRGPEVGENGVKVFSCRRCDVAVPAAGLPPALPDRRVLTWIGIVVGVVVAIGGALVVGVSPVRITAQSAVSLIVLAVIYQVWMKSIEGRPPSATARPQRGAPPLRSRDDGDGSPHR